MPIAAADAFYQVQKPGTMIYSHGVKPSHASRQFHYISNILFYSYDSQYRTTKTAYKASFSPLLISKKSVAGPTPQGFGCQILLQCASSRSRQGQPCQCASIEPSHQQTALSKINFQDFLGCEIIWCQETSAYDQ
jgi:hypothetical protein